MTQTHFDVLIVGAGLSGIGAAYNIQKEFPSRSYAVLEAREAIGGTWDLFRYPGIRSDSDMYTLGYNFKPWRGEKAIADGADTNTDFAFMVAKFKPDGSLDNTFGTNGVAKKNVVVGKAGEVARGIIVQSTGKIVIAGTVDHLTGGGWLPSGGQVDEGALTTPDEPSEQRECSPDDGGHDQGAAQAGVGVGGCAHGGPPPSGGMFMVPVVPRSTYTSSRARVGSVPSSRCPHRTG